MTNSRNTVLLYRDVQIFSTTWEKNLYISEMEYTRKLTNDTEEKEMKYKLKYKIKYKPYFVQKNAVKT